MGNSVLCCDGRNEGRDREGAWMKHLEQESRRKEREATRAAVWGQPQAGFSVSDTAASNSSSSMMSSNRKENESNNANNNLNSERIDDQAQPIKLTVRRSSLAATPSARMDDDELSESREFNRMVVQVLQQKRRHKAAEEERSRSPSPSRASSPSSLASADPARHRDHLFWRRWQRSSGDKPRHDKRDVNRSRVRKALRKALSKRDAAPAGGVADEQGGGHSFGRARQRPAVEASNTAEVEAFEERQNNFGFKAPGGAIGTARRIAVPDHLMMPGPGEHAGARTSALGTQHESGKRSMPGYSMGRSTRGRRRANAVGGSGVGYCDDGSGDLWTRAGVESHSFGRAKRGQVSETSRGSLFEACVGDYDPRIAKDERHAVVGPAPKTSSFLKLQDEIARANTFRLRPVLDCSGYGFSCDRQDHVEFGQCVAGGCSRRATWERNSGKIPDDPNYVPAAHVAVLGHRGRAETLLVLSQVDVNERDHDGRTVLHAVAAQGFTSPRSQLSKVAQVKRAAEETAQQLEVNAQDANGDTALHLAVWSEQTEVVEALLELGADPEIDNSRGESCLDLAKALHGQQKIYQLVQARIALWDLEGELAEIRREHRLEESRRRAVTRASRVLASRATTTTTQGYIIGLGLGDEKDITVNGLDAVRKCDKVFLEHYTSILGVDVDKLEAFYGKEVTLADRDLVESGSEAILADAKDRDVALLIVGDPFGATTHTDMYLRAVQEGIEVRVMHNASIMNAVGSCGLQLYNYGQTVSIPLFQGNWKPDSFYDKIASNMKDNLHTLCLLDIKVKEPNIEMLETRGKLVYDPPRYMTVKEACEQLLYIEEEVRHSGVLSRETLCVGVARIGQADQKIVSGTLNDMLEVDMGPPLHSLVLCGAVHPLEEDMLALFRHHKSDGDSVSNNTKADQQVVADD
ncbi:Diphthine methyl ester synthase (Diphthamide biosynthesis methyltransferase) [Durusdinium trenchii]|uniref:diphthine methyl ester synthase n=1 Tax=Durusdinium trenchii TaxID=1381693 RepID=A0ABP0QSG2_9DINO